MLKKIPSLALFIIFCGYIRSASLPTFDSYWLQTMAQRYDVMPEQSLTPEQIVQELFALYEHADQEAYIGEGVSQLAHALQTAQQALESGQDEATIIAALFHDIGHRYTGKNMQDMDGFGMNEHELIGAALLAARGFSPQIATLVAGHVQAKRYNIFKSEAYRGRLTVASLETLARQGGPMNAQEANEFEKHPLFKEMLLLRSWDEQAKIPDAITQPLSYYKEMIVRHITHTQTQKNSFIYLITQNDLYQAAHQKNGYVINSPGLYQLAEDIKWFPETYDSFIITIAADYVILNGNGHSIQQINHSVRNIFGVQVKENVHHVEINNMHLHALSGGGIWFRGGNENLTMKDLRISQCSYYGHTPVDPKKIGPLMPAFVAPGILLDGGYGKSIKHVHIVDCSFIEHGILRNPERYEAVSSGLVICHASDVTITRCTVDGCVARDIATGIILAHVSELLVSDAFITDIFSSKKSYGIYTHEIEGEIRDTPQFQRASHVNPQYFGYYLDSHFTPKETVSDNPAYLIEAALIKQIVPQYKERMESLIQEHHWREFRGLSRLVCHNSHLKSETSAIYGAWVELFCEKVLGVKVKVESGFANLYLNGDTHLPTHRDQYKKWIFGLSFGQTRTLDFIPDDETAKIISYVMEAGDVLLFSPEVNNRYQHRMLAEPERTGRRINLTYFLEILPGQDSKKLLLSTAIDPSCIPTFEEAVAFYEQKRIAEPEKKLILQDEEGNLFEEIDGKVVPYKTLVS